MPVILIHGLWLNSFFMALLARRIKQHGFIIKTYSYPSMRLTLSDNASRLADFCAQLDAPRVQIVSHSLGGLVALKMLQTPSYPRCESLLMLGTPYAQSHAAQALARLPGGKALLGHSMTQWLADPPPPLPDCAIGILAGTRGFGLGRLVAPDLPSPNDGAVSVAETELPGHHQRILMNVSHSEMLYSREVANQCAHFLRMGHFTQST